MISPLIKQNNVVIVLCTVPNDFRFISNLAKNLIKHKLAACITVLSNIYSFYYWNNEIENKNEAQLLIKTEKFLQPLVFEKIKKFHPYKIPELITLAIDYGEINYLLWIKNFLNTKNINS